MKRTPHILQSVQALILVIITTCANSATTEPTSAFELNQDSQPENLGIYTQYIEDPDGTLFLDDILHAETDKDSANQSQLFWQQAPHDGLAKGFTDSVYWLRFAVKNTSAEMVRWYLEIRYPILDSVELYTPDESGDYSKMHLGDSLPFNERPIDYRNLVFQHNTAPNEHDVYYLRVKTSSSMYVPLQIWPHDTFFHEIDRVKLLLGVLYGIVILALLISAVNAYFLKDLMYVWLSGIFICFILYLASIKGVAFQSIWPNSLYWQEVSVPFFMCLSWVFAFLYARDYISIKTFMPKLDKIFVAFSVFSIIAALVCLIVPYRYVISFSTITTILTQIILTILGLYSWYNGNRAARLFVFSWISLVIGAASFAFLALGWIPRNFLTEWMQEIGFGSMVTLMIIAQFDRFLQIQKGHEGRQKASLAALKQAETKYRSLFENAIEGIFQMSASGRLTNVNNAFANILGIEEVDQIVETRDAPFTLGFLSESESKKLEAMLNTKGGISDYNVSFASPRGEIRWAAIAIQKVQKPNESSFHYEGSLTDITETKKREQAEKHRRMAEASTEAKSMFLANMSHEIRTPMNAIIGFTDLAVNANQDKNLSEFLRKIKTASSNLLGIINDILDFSKIEAGKLKIESVPFNVREMMGNIEDIVSSNIEAKGLDFTIDIDEDIPEVLIGDSLRLHQVLLNLTNNAVKFTPEGSVKVELDLLAMNKKNGSIKLAGRVIDTGIGISQEKQQKLFTSFSQADESTTRTFGGTGLGLSISKQLITMMGGDIKVRSIEGKGSVFEFDFACRLESRKRGKGKEQSKLNILIVDDNQDSRQLIESVISTLHHSYTSVSSGKEAIKLLKQPEDDGEHFDLALIDWLMPDLDGLECRKEIGQLPKTDHLKTILVTTYSEEGLEDKSKEVGFDAFMEKPLTLSAIQQQIANLFQVHSSKDQKPQSSELLTHSDAEETTFTTEEKLNDKTSAKDMYDFSGLNALLVEDVAMNQELAKEILGKQGIHTFIANNGEEGVNRASSESFDFILMDMQMPVMDGIEASKAIRQLDQQIPIIAMTANAMTEDKKKCLDAGMDGFVTKPINDNELFTAIAKHVSKVKPLSLHASQDLGTEQTVSQQTDAEPALSGQIQKATSDSVETVVSESAPDFAESTVSRETPAESLTKITTDADEQTETPPANTVVQSEHIDLQDGLDRCQGNQTLYHKLLGDFIRNYGSSASEMRELKEAGDLISLGKMAHTLKGLSANLGAKALSAHAMKLEKISDLGSDDQISSLDLFEHELNALITTLEPILASYQQENPSQGDSEPYTIDELNGVLTELEDMIQQQKMDAYDLSVEAAKKWPKEDQKELLNALVEQLDLFDFDSAKETLKTIQEQLE